MRNSVDRDSTPLFPCPRCQKLARRVQRRRWTARRLIVPLVIGIAVGAVFTLATGTVAMGSLVGLMSAAIAFALAPITYLNLECDTCGYEEVLD